jgi:hypothetical protein
MATMIIPSRAYGAPRKSAAKVGLWTHFLEALKASRQRQADEIVAQYASGRWSDSVEREINEKLIHAEGLRLF